MRRIGEYSEEQVEGYVRRQTPLGLAVKIGAVLIAISLCLGGVGFVAGWFKTGVEVISPENVKAQWQFAYDYDASLKAIAKQWCTAKIEETNETDKEVRPQRVSQRIAIENNYQRVKAEYDGRLRDAFRAGLVKPPDVPRSAPNLPDVVAATGCMSP